LPRTESARHESGQGERVVSGARTADRGGPCSKAASRARYSLKKRQVDASEAASLAEIAIDWNVPLARVSAFLDHKAHAAAAK
jgi:hypothetical protein